VKGKDKDAEHTCDPGVKETVALIIKESKACPKCGERISKIDGCDQMWCVDCHTAFSWTTGQLVTGVVHNPHYYEFLRKQGGGAAPRNAGDVPCGGVPYFHILQQNIKNLDKATQTFIIGVHRITAEIADYRVTVYQGHFNVNDNGDLGMKYLMQELDKDDLKAELVKREIKRNKHLAIRAVLEMFVNTSTMMLNNIVSHPPGEEVNTQLTAANTALKDTTKIYMTRRTQWESLTSRLSETLSEDERKSIVAQYDEMQKELQRYEKRLETMRKDRDELEVKVRSLAAEEFAGVVLAYTNLRTYVNDSLMGVSRMKNCSVPQIGEDWLWKPFNKCAPKGRRTRVAEAVEDAEEDA